MPTWQNFPKPLFFKRRFVKSVLELVRKHRDNERFKTTPLLRKKCERKKASVHSERGSARRWNLSSPTTLGLLLKLWELFSLNAIRAQVVIDGHKVSRLRSFSVLPLLSLDMMDVCFYVFYKLCPPVPWHFEDSFLFVFLSVFFFFNLSVISVESWQGPGCYMGLIQLGWKKKQCVLHFSKNCQIFKKKRGYQKVS